jgi:hypothetical protein
LCAAHYFDKKELKKRGRGNLFLKLFLGVPT